MDKKGQNIFLKKKNSFRNITIGPEPEAELKFEHHLFLAIMCKHNVIHKTG